MKTLMQGSIESGVPVYTRQITEVNETRYVNCIHIKDFVYIVIYCKLRAKAAFERYARVGVAKFEYPLILSDSVLD